MILLLRSADAVWNIIKFVRKININGYLRFHAVWQECRDQVSAKLRSSDKTGRMQRSGYRSRAVRVYVNRSLIIYYIVSFRKPELRIFSSRGRNEIWKVRRNWILLISPVLDMYGTIRILNQTAGSKTKRSKKIQRQLLEWIALGAHGAWTHIFTNYLTQIYSAPDYPQRVISMGVLSGGQEGPDCGNMLLNVLVSS